MGKSVDGESSTPTDRERFSRKLTENLSALRDLIERPGFGAGPATLGAELEVSLVDAQGRPLPVNERILEQTPHPGFQLEIDRFNLEYNLSPTPLAGRSFSELEARLAEGLRLLEDAARPHGARVVPIGILPTLTGEDLGPEVLTNVPRYRILAEDLRHVRGKPFRLRIDGPEPLDTQSEDVSFEGANTSLQIHLRVPPDEFADTYNALQIATPLALAASANAPLFLGHLLWDETRVALFKQSIDSRPADALAWHAPARVSFGHGWVREGALELFSEATALFEPLLPALTPEDPLACVRSGGTPRLEELRIHQSTVWRWNRAIYDPADGGHLRIEARSLPSGPTPRDMAAGAAFLLGLTLGLRPRVRSLLPGFPFEYAHYNFYRAAQHGFDARLLWPAEGAPSPREVRAHDLVRDLLPTAERGLTASGVDPADVRWTTELIRARLDGNMNGARWQRAVLAKLDSSHPRPEALRELLDRYLHEASRGVPVTEWRRPT